MITLLFARQLSLLFASCTNSAGEINYNIFFLRPICCATANRFAVIQFDHKQQSLDKNALP
jgi:hypothetical protein